MRSIINRGLVLSAIFVSGYIFTTIKAQDTLDKMSIFEVLAEPISGEGLIHIFQAPQIAKMVGTPIFSGELDTSGRFIVLQGYRVQLYSGNSHQSKSIATERANQVREAFPELDISVEYQAPFWRLRVGAFVQMDEAREYMTELQKSFLPFAKEMYIVRSTIRIPR